MMTNVENSVYDIPDLPNGTRIIVDWSNSDRKGWGAKGVITTKPSDRDGGMGLAKCYEYVEVMNNHNFMDVTILTKSSITIDKQYYREERLKQILE